jgi:orotate phosphoribosyltransferase-like protein
VGEQAQIDLDHVRSLLESITLLENVAAKREGKVEEILGFLSSQGLTAEELADRLEVSRESIRTLLQRDEPKPVHERMGVSEQTVQSLDPNAA